MSHIRNVTRKPQLAQTNFQSKLDFLFSTYQNVLDLLFQSQHGALK